MARVQEYEDDIRQRMEAAAAMEAEHQAELALRQATEAANRLPLSAESAHDQDPSSAAVAYHQLSEKQQVDTQPIASINPTLQSTQGME